MEPIISHWLPIVLSAAAVFIISFVIHMVFTYHNSDFGMLPSEAEVMDDLRKANLPPGNYMMPYASTNKERQTQEYIDKMNKGPVAFIRVFPSGQFKMGGTLLQWFVYCIVVGVFAAYIAGHSLPSDASYLQVFRIAGASAFAGYTLALWQNAIWFTQNWKATLKSTFDGLIYALFTGGIFGWLW